MVKFERAKRSDVHLIIGLAGGTGSGKTWSAYELAKGLAGGKPFAVIDTESGRGKHYADHFTFDHADLDAPFTAERYIEAIEAAEKGGYPVVVVDSLSHSHAGEGGMLDQHEAELQRMAGDDWKKRKACSQAAWVRPKASIKRLLYRLLRARCHLILCLRAEEKTEMVKDSKGEWQMVPKKGPAGFKGWVPICDKGFPFDLTMSLLLTHEAPGVPRPIKLEEDHRGIVLLDEPLSSKTGEWLAAWASGGAAQKVETGDEPAGFAEEARSADLRDGYRQEIDEAPDEPALRALIAEIAASPKVLPEDKAALKPAIQARLESFKQKERAT